MSVIWPPPHPLTDQCVAILQLQSWSTLDTDGFWRIPRVRFPCAHGVLQWTDAANQSVIEEEENLFM